jgi:polyether ionophore transport system permease protein
MTLLRIALAQQRTGLIAMTVMGVAAGVLNALGFVQVAGTTPVERLAFAQSMEALGAQLSYMLPVPEHLDTLAGYLQWRAFGFIVLILGIWAVISSTGGGRGDEERGLVEEWLAAGTSRARYIGTRVVVFTAVAAFAIAATMVLTYLAGRASGEPLAVAGMTAAGLNLLVTTLVCFGIGLVVAQLVTTRRAAGFGAAGLVIALFLINGASRTADVGPIRWLSPFYLYERSRPLTSGGALEIGALTALVIAPLVLIALAVAAFVRRDLGGTALPRTSRTTRPSTAPSRDPLLRIPVVAVLRQQWLWIATWTLALAALSGFLGSIVKTVIDSLTTSSTPVMRAYFERAGLRGYDSFVGAIWLSTLMLILAAYAIVQVQSWSSDDAEGRLGTILAAPVSRSRVVLERLVALLIAVGVICAAAGIAVYWVATSQSIALDGSKLALATALVVTIPVAFAAIGQLLAVWRPRVALVLLSTLAVVSYFLVEFVPLFGWPEWVANLSLFSLYGMPMSGEVNWGGIAGLIGVAIAGTIGALFAVQRRDVGA